MPLMPVLNFLLHSPGSVGQAAWVKASSCNWLVSSSINIDDIHQASGSALQAEVQTQNSSMIASKDRERTHTLTRYQLPHNLSVR